MTVPIAEEAIEILRRIRKEKPLIHNITNYVVMNDSANIILHLGALPVMAHAEEEVCEMTEHSNALIINIGTLSSHWVESMILAGKHANKTGIPVILDIVGAGATRYRSEVAMKLMNDIKFSVIKGNSGEIGSVSGAGGQVRGVESLGRDISGFDQAVKEFALKRKTVVVVTGKRDLITDGQEIYMVSNGHEYLTTITGTGCMSTCAVAVFCSVEKRTCLASASALSCFGICSEIAAEKANGPASFKTAFFDAIYNLTSKEITDRMKIEHEK